jgi:hypothetical protein
VECGPTARISISVLQTAGEAKRSIFYFDLQNVVISTDTLVMHFMVGIVGVATTLILDKRKSTSVSTTLELT